MITKERAILIYLINNGINIVDGNNNIVAVEQLKDELFDISLTSFKELYGGNSPSNFYFLGGEKTGFVKLMRRDYPEEVITLLGQEMMSFLHQYDDCDDNFDRQSVIAGVFREADNKQWVQLAR